MTGSRATMKRLIFILFLAYLIAPVLAADYTGTFTAPLSPATQIFPGYSAGGVGYSPAWNIFKWITNATSSGTPESLLMYAPSDMKITGSGSFFINNTATGLDYASGILYCQIYRVKLIP